MVDILYAKVTQSKEIYCVERTSNQRSHSTTVGAEINSVQEKHLLAPCLNDYSAFVAPHCATGHLTPSNTEATIDASASFFVVHTSVVASLHSAAHVRVESMVVQAGQPSGWPVSSVAGSEISAWTTTHESLTSGGSNIRYTEEVDAMSSAPTRSRLKFTDTYWIIPLYSNIPYGKVSFTHQEARLFRVMFEDSRLIWAGRQPVGSTTYVKHTRLQKHSVKGTASTHHEGIEEISIPKGGVNITPPSTITEIVTGQGVAHV